MRNLEIELRRAVSDEEVRDLFKCVSHDFFRHHIRGEKALLGQIGPLARSEGYHYSPRHALEFAEILDMMVPIGSLMVPIKKNAARLPLRYFYYLGRHEERVRGALGGSIYLQEFKLENLISQVFGPTEDLPTIHDLYDANKFHRTAVAIRKVGLRTGPGNLTVEKVLCGFGLPVFGMKASERKNHGHLSYFHHTGDEEALLEYAKSNLI